MTRVLLIDENPDRLADLADALHRLGYEVIAHPSLSLDMDEQVAVMQPDVIVIDNDSPSRDTLENICVVSRNHPRPIVMFTQDGDSLKIRAAVRAGVSSYVVNGLDPARIRPILEVATSRFEAFQALRSELDRANTTLAERKLIERAKGILMNRRGCCEEEAYQALRKMAMDRSLKIVEVARQVIAIADMI